ncbi:MAG: hypothetical protein NVSMB46_01980 [Candidatus Saccharimonadales bacterium]
MRLYLINKVGRFLFGRKVKINMKKTYSAGAIVINNQGLIAVVNNRGRSWSFPKGHVEKNEDVLEAAKREVYEETGIKDFNVVKELGSYERPRIGQDGEDDQSEIKHITIYLFTTHETKLVPVDPENPVAVWCNVETVGNLLSHIEDYIFMTSVINDIKTTINKQSNV